MTVLPTAGREAMERAIESTKSTMPEPSGNWCRRVWEAARDFYGPERVAELERDLDAIRVMLPPALPIESLAQVADQVRTQRDEWERTARESQQRERVLRKALEHAKGIMETAVREMTPAARQQNAIMIGEQADDMLLAMHPAIRKARAALAVSPEQSEGE